MSIFKCKMCGGTIEFEQGASVGVCDSCGTKQTLPRLDDDKKANLYDRANHFRRNNEFDKAMSIYEQILNEDNTDAEAYWSLVLCRYGIEYVEDPSTHKRIPTVNRTQYTSIFDDEDYKSALQYADGYQKEIYEQEADAINEIQKGILSISQKEEPFDVFICYKETDNSGRRTPDSVLANDLYHQLTQEGFKVFFARITLEDKLGSAYEPYIFAALNSAKVMVVLGTKPEYFNAVWVKNEWSRYLALIKQGQKKMLIPAYKDMDPYDLPEEFSHLQAQDMSKLGFMQDLIRGIKKITQDETQKTTVVKETVITGSNGSTAPLLKRAFMFLEDGDWNSANEYCEKVLDIDPENASAYLGKLMVDLRVKKQEALPDQSVPFDSNNNYQKALRFADENLKAVLAGYIEHIKERNEKARLEARYIYAKNAMDENDYKEAARVFETISEYLDSAELTQTCNEKAEEARKDAVLAEGKSKMNGEEAFQYKTAIRLFETVPGWKDADEMVCICKRKIEEIEVKKEAERLECERKAEQRKKQNKILGIISISIICIVIAFLIVFVVITTNNKYNDAVAAMEAGDTDKAYSIFSGLGNYRDAAEKVRDILEVQFENIKTGDCIKFGAYEQDNNTANGKEDIEWLVLAKEDNKVLVISKYALDCKRYNNTYADIAWEKCSLRDWLNNDFINSAFSDGEKAIIPAVTVSADKNPEYNTNPGNATNDKVFLLSVTEAGKYFSTNSARCCKPTQYASANGAYVSDNNCGWWLRSPGYESPGAIVYIGGSNMIDYYPVDSDIACVRPALWISID